MISNNASLSIVLPCYNEETSIAPVFSSLLRERDRLLKSGIFKNIDIVVIDDGSTDQSLSQLRSFQSDVQIFPLDHNKGYGEALKTGFQKAKGDWICFFDLDNTCSPSDIAPLYQQMLTDGNFMGLGTRLNPSSKMPWVRFLGNHIYRNLVSLLLRQPIADCCTGFRIFHRRFLPLFLDPLPSQLNYSLAMTIAYLRLGERITERGIQYNERMGHSKLNALIDGPRFLLTLIHYALSPRFSKNRLRGWLT
ncbi:MAG: glycosyltransferase family 2 protein [Bdellovibrionales bacterium]|nr:glycosyltransferase family 2 protein [Bdellovibrionales bacterium]